jgi:chromosome segregation ATPase
VSGLVDTLISAGVGGGIATGWMLVGKWRDARQTRAEKVTEQAEATSAADVTARVELAKVESADDAAVRKELWERLKGLEVSREECRAENLALRDKIHEAQRELAVKILELTQLRDNFQALNGEVDALERRCSALAVENAELRRQLVAGR